MNAEGRDPPKLLALLVLLGETIAVAHHEYEPEINPYPRLVFARGDCEVHALLLVLILAIPILSSLSFSVQVHEAAKPLVVYLSDEMSLI